MSRGPGDRALRAAIRPVGPGHSAGLRPGPTGVPRHRHRAPRDAGGGGRPIAKDAPDLYAALATAPFDNADRTARRSDPRQEDAGRIAVVRVLGAGRDQGQAARPAGKPGAKAATPGPRRAAGPARQGPRLPGRRACSLPRPTRSCGSRAAPATGGNAQIVKILAATVAADPRGGRQTEGPHRRPGRGPGRRGGRHPAAGRVRRRGGRDRPAARCAGSRTGPTSTWSWWTTTSSIRCCPTCCRNSGPTAGPAPCRSW